MRLELKKQLVTGNKIQVDTSNMVFFWVSFYRVVVQRSSKKWGRLTTTRYRNPKDYHMINNLRTVQSCYNRINTKITGSLHWES